MSEVRINGVAVGHLVQGWPKSLRGHSKMARYSSTCTGRMPTGKPNMQNIPRAVYAGKYLFLIAGKRRVVLCIGRSVLDTKERHIRSDDPSFSATNPVRAWLDEHGGRGKLKIMDRWQHHSGWSPWRLGEEPRSFSRQPWRLWESRGMAALAQLGSR